MNEVSICELVEMLLRCFEKYELCYNFLLFVGFKDIESSVYYGKGYQDVEYCIFSICNVCCILDWQLEIVLE